jgi:hypothetical protein
MEQPHDYAIDALLWDNPTTWDGLADVAHGLLQGAHQGLQQLALSVDQRSLAWSEALNMLAAQAKSFSAFYYGASYMAANEADQSFDRYGNHLKRSWIIGSALHETRDAIIVLLEKASGQTIFDLTQDEKTKAKEKYLWSMADFEQKEKLESYWSRAVGAGFKITPDDLDRFINTTMRPLPHVKKDEPVPFYIMKYVKDILALTQIQIGAPPGPQP